MPYSDGSWGEQAKLRSKRRREYFREYKREHPQNLSSYYQQHHEEINERQKSVPLSIDEKTQRKLRLIL